MTELRMGLLATRHENDATAALSIASNRASKIRKLLDADRDEQARRFLTALDTDVEAFLVSRRGRRACERSSTLAVELRRIVVVERGLFPLED